LLTTEVTRLPTKIAAESDKVGSSSRFRQRMMH
jgi:hypothetical protein